MSLDFIENYLDIYFEQIDDHQVKSKIGLRDCTYGELYGVDEPTDMKDKKNFNFICPKDREQLVMYMDKHAHKSKYFNLVIVPHYRKY